MMQYVHVTQHQDSLNDSTSTIAAAAGSSSLADARNYDPADGVDYRGLTAFALLSMAVSACQNLSPHRFKLIQPSNFSQRPPQTARVYPSPV